MNLSIKNATLAIYPLSSKNAIQTNSARITGKSTNIPPTPPMIPSTNNDWNQGDVFASNVCIHGINESFNNPSNQSDIGCPTQAKVNWNINAIIRINNG